eukprot:TRINITY_DN10323_c0_g1_i1.p2 TRINITY_DN10323_c0_g1~~TRINITY_DN10323_c0_g1_i1.p2  ORF type:complete len:123 (+),score=33.37 TRINITY_DN10323_c0_g1_i1:280-648(+)
MTVGDGEPVRVHGGFLFEIRLFVVSLFATLVPGVHPAPVLYEAAEPEATEEEAAAMAEGEVDGNLGGEAEDGMMHEDEEDLSQSTAAVDECTESDERDAVMTLEQSEDSDSMAEGSDDDFSE